ncbi:SAM-dependent methyltransferase [Streptomyces sp. HC44]|uniref:SAM-dependent methyltransferase n=1 Tax=Streptomyces scabichelini TaxID=2711217 RepID=A0A6G4VF93_9ACTN|nr:SAM-dependent methyltransferase [Streptomyces scabichelini]NGO12490.1 SAM-dependent methyltransferase [Streptomyces scabichelini]
MAGTEPSLHRIDTSKPHPARVYDWYLGGKDNYQIDEELGRQILALEPQAKLSARSNRWFMHRATRWLAREAGIRQFLDIGTGIPTEPNLHQIAQSTARDARIVYVDNDPIVLAHAEALLRGTPEGVTEYVQADVREPRKILDQAERVLDFDRPIALSLIALMHFVSDDDGAYDLVGSLVDALPAGSCLVLSMITGDYDPENMERAVQMYAAGGVTLVARSHAEVTRFFTGLELVEPGVVSLPQWHPELAEGEDPLGDTQVPLYAGVGIKGP